MTTLKGNESPRIVQSGKLTPSEYRQLHYWVESKLGKPMWCWSCKDKSKGYYEWANRSQEYHKDIFDWERLCKKCHMIKDIESFKNNKGFFPQDYCKRGHKMEGDNLYFKPPRGDRECRACKKLFHSVEWLKRKERDDRQKIYD